MLLAALLASGLAIWLWRTMPAPPNSTLVGLQPSSQVTPIFVEPPASPESPAWLNKLSGGPSVNTRAECNRINGLWVKRAAMGTQWMCFTRTPDAGKPCTDHSECQAICLASKPVHAGASPIVGACSRFFEAENTCAQGVSHGTAEPEWCID